MAPMRGFATNAIHAGQDPDPHTGAVITPIHPSSTYAQDGVGGLRAGGYEYSRSANPTRTALQECLAALEGGRHGRAYGSGMGATDVLLRVLLRPGDHLVIPHDAYGGTFRLVDKLLRPWGVDYTPVNLSDLDELRAALRPQTRVVWCETPTNPLLGIADIAAIADVARTAGARLVVDNTFASPYLQQPLQLGADVALHSTTKYIGGHSDVVGGALVTNDEELDTAFAFLQNGAGAVPGPFDAFLTLRGIKTLSLRMERHSENAVAVARFLQEHPKVTWVNYPGLPTHPSYATASKYHFRGQFGAILGFGIDGGIEAGKKFIESVKLFSHLANIGDAKSLVIHPASTTHSQLTIDEQALTGVTADYVRLSVGIETVSDLIDDLDQALAQV